MQHSTTKDRKNLAQKAVIWLISSSGIPWSEVIGELWKNLRKIWGGLAKVGIYEVMNHEATLEVQDSKGKRAKVTKRQKVRYLQDNIIAYQDQG